MLVAAFLDPPGPLTSVRVSRDEERPCEQNAIDPNASGDDVYRVAVRIRVKNIVRAAAPGIPFLSPQF